MAFFDQFKRSKSAQQNEPATDENLSEPKSLLAAVSKGSVASRTCSICGVSYDQPNQGTPPLVIDINEWTLDLGGYCPNCRLYLCPKHVQLVKSGKFEVLGSAHDSYVRVCATCQTKLTDTESDDPKVPPPWVFVSVSM